ncbi:MAG: hypothetical protein JO060_10415 [Candidatus Eremiobacteraeota bacterium]|nr:hypothetical protein [Candidatus Eremiobacteraeota bacterium]
MISGEFLLEACNYGPAAVLAYRKNVSGKQHFVRKIAPFLSPSVIRIGP